MRLPDRRTRERLRARLLAWYAADARDLPWRRTTDPYAIWVSEAMLQQTRVETVRAYWTRFLAAFPSVRDLAAASEQAVLACWSGLGYYRRARALHAAARAMVERHGGEFPRAHADALALPGVGPYTAAAVLSIAHDQALPLVDGNVARVLARRFLLEDPIGSTGLERDAWALARALVPETGAGTWNQALMELGATVCRPRAPRCGACPWAQACRAPELPRPRGRRAPVEVALELAWAEDGDALLLERRPARGRMAGLWQLPTREVTSSGLFPDSWPDGPRVVLGDDLGGLAHGITHHRIRARLRASRVAGELPESWSWVPRARLAHLPLTGMARKALRALQPTAPPAEVAGTDTLPRPSPGAQPSPSPRSAPRA